MICARCQRRPVRLSRRSPLCIVCAVKVRVANAVASRIEREFRRHQRRLWRERRAA